MSTLPALTPVTTPVPAPTVAVDEFELLHEPPAVASDNVVVEPAHTLNVPLIAAGVGSTVIVKVLVGPIQLTPPLV